jgi:hypothetical protein
MAKNVDVTAAVVARGRRVRTPDDGARERNRSEVVVVTFREGRPATAPIVAFATSNHASFAGEGFEPSKFSCSTAELRVAAVGVEPTTPS